MTDQQQTQRGRATVFVVAGVCAALLAVPFSMWLSRAPSSMSQFERLGTELGCQCGTCPMRPIATCGCGFADGMLARLSAETAADKSDAEIMVIFAAVYGPGIKIKPEGRGFGLLAWVPPIMLLLVGGVVIAAVIARWREQASVQVHTAAAVGERTGPDEDDEYRRLVERELGSLRD